MPEARLGGSVLAVGAYSAELIASQQGEVQAFLYDSALVPVQAAADLKVRAFVTLKGGAREEVALNFDSALGGFSGKLNAGVSLSPGPIELAVEAKQAVALGGLASIALRVNARHGGQVLAVGDFSVELVASGSSVSAFVFDAAGTAHATGDLELELAVAAGRAR
jgi:hypothetical protein